MDCTANTHTESLVQTAHSTTKSKVKQDSPKDFRLFPDASVEENGFQKAPKNCRIKGEREREGEIEGGENMGKKEMEIWNQKVLVKSDTVHRPLVV